MVRIMNRVVRLITTHFIRTKQTQFIYHTARKVYKFLNKFLERQKQAKITKDNKKTLTDSSIRIRPDISIFFIKNR